MADWDDGPTGGFTFGNLFRPPTPEEAAERKAAAAERLARGDALAFMLPKANPTAACVKCGHAKTSAAFCPGGESAHWGCQDKAGYTEHLHIVCKRCGYGWLTLCADGGAP